MHGRHLLLQLFHQRDGAIIFTFNCKNAFREATVHGDDLAPPVLLWAGRLDAAPLYRHDKRHTWHPGLIVAQDGLAAAARGQKLERLRLVVKRADALSPCARAYGPAGRHDYGPHATRYDDTGGYASEEVQL